jgi:hypothetical protein
MFLGLELCLVVICLALAYTRPPQIEWFFTPIEQRLRIFAGKKILAVATVGLLALGIRLAMLPVMPLPAPEIHDEFSHLLLADTLAHGRLANPTHPMWIHFETFHVNWHPTYASMYFPGQGIFLAFGQVVLGHPFWGVWLSCGLMCAAICWALQGWMPPLWALLGGLLAVIRLGTFSYWANSYWGGAVAALGGALVLGAYPRVKSDLKILDSLLLGTGMVVLALSRPYEGFFFCLPVVIALIAWGFKQKSGSTAVVLKRIALPTTGVLAVGIGWLGYYFWRVTGSPFTTPYQINIRMYGLVYFPWEKIKQVPAFHHEVMRLFYRGQWVVGVFNFSHERPFELQFLKGLVIWLFYFGPLLTTPWIVWLLAGPRRMFWKSMDPQLRFLLLLCATTYFSIMLTIYVGQPHYAAPMTAAVYAATMIVMRDLACSPSGKWLIRSILLAASVLFLTVIGSYALTVKPNVSWIRIWCTPTFENLQRARVKSELENMPGQQLAIVRYKPDHDFSYDEWVFNGADIGGSKVIWARDMGNQNSELVDYFKDRQVWLVEPDYHPAKLSPYQPSTEKALVTN